MSFYGEKDLTTCFFDEFSSDELSRCLKIYKRTKSVDSRAALNDFLSNKIIYLLSKAETIRLVKALPILMRLINNPLMPILPNNIRRRLVLPAIVPFFVWFLSKKFLKRADASNFPNLSGVASGALALIGNFYGPEFFQKQADALLHSFFLTHELWDNLLELSYPGLEANFIEIEKERLSDLQELEYKSLIKEILSTKLTIKTAKKYGEINNLYIFNQKSALKKAESLGFFKRSWLNKFFSFDNFDD